MKNPIFRISIKQKSRKTSNENIDFKHGMYLTVTTLKNQILRINIKNNTRKPVIRKYILGKRFAQESPLWRAKFSKIITFWAWDV